MSTLFLYALCICFAYCRFLYVDIESVNSLSDIQNNPSLNRTLFVLIENCPKAVSKIEKVFVAPMVTEWSGAVELSLPLCYDSY